MLQESAKQSDKENVKETGGRHGKKPRLAHSSLDEDDEKEDKEKKKNKENKKVKGNKLANFMIQNQQKHKSDEEQKQSLKNHHNDNNNNNNNSDEEELETSSRIVLKQLKQLQFLAQSPDPDPKKINVSALHPATLRILKKLDEGQRQNKILDKTGLTAKMKMFEQQREQQKLHHNEGDGDDSEDNNNGNDNSID